jgi:hypothetical protein
VEQVATDNSVPSLVVRGPDYYLLRTLDPLPRSWEGLPKVLRSNVEIHQRQSS